MSNANLINKLILGDCLEVMQEIDDKSVDLILCDLPYGTTNAVWDSVIPISLMWNSYERIIKDNGVIVLTAQNPFSSLLVSSNFNWYKHSHVWKKNVSSNFQLAKNQPIKIHEDILVFSKAGFTYNAKNKATYNPIMIPRKTIIKPRKTESKNKHLVEINPRPNPSLIKRDKANLEFKLPTSIIDIPIETKDKLHPTQKPVALLEYLIKTYSQENDLVLDNCFGSGSTLVAAKNLNRQFIGIEIEEKYFNIAKKRLNIE